MTIRLNSCDNPNRVEACATFCMHSTAEGRFSVRGTGPFFLRLS